MKNQISKSGLRALRALDAAPEKELTFDQLRRQAGLTQRGFGIVWRRLEASNRVARVEGKLAVATLTFGGVRLLKSLAGH